MVQGDKGVTMTSGQLLVFVYTSQQALLLTAGLLNDANDTVSNLYTYIHTSVDGASVNMGIPYSREINAAFEQVTPLVAAGYEVLTTTKDIAILLAVIQVLTVALLFLILLALLGLLVSVNPDLASERERLVTPALKMLAGLVLAYGRIGKWLLNILLVVVMIGYGMFLWRGYFAGLRLPRPEDEELDETPGEDNEEKNDDKDPKSKASKK